MRIRNAHFKTHKHEKRNHTRVNPNGNGISSNIYTGIDMKELFIRHGAATELLSMARELQADMDNCQDEAIASEFQDRIDALMRSYVQILYNQISKIEGL